MGSDLHISHFFHKLDAVPLITIAPRCGCCQLPMATDPPLNRLGDLRLNATERVKNRTREIFRNSPAHPARLRRGERSRPTI